MRTENTHSMENMPVPKQRPPYLLGLLGLIPLVGAFAGFALLLMAIFKYKDKWLAIIGIGGILITVGLYSFLFYYMKHGKSSQEAFARISQIQLNSLMKNVEFYKLETGKYPDSLQQLSRRDEFVPVYDPIQAVQDRGNKLYNYENLGDKYLLFSSGQDGIPNTDDDLFPEIKVMDRSKIGWVRSRMGLPQ